MTIKEPPTLLLVEDEALVALTTKRLLEIKGYQVIIASSGNDALEKFYASPKINLVLMDINLGKGMDGTEAAKLILQERDLPVIFLSAYNDPEIVEKTEKITSYGYVVKGSGETVLLTSIKMALRLHSAHLQLMENEARLRDITFSMADWVWEVDENDLYTYSSNKGVEFFGKTGENIIGKTPFSLMPTDEGKKVASLFHELKANKAPIKDLENWNIKENGEKICLLTNGVPILDEHGNLKGYRGVDKDITERKHVEEVLHKGLASLKKAEKIAKLGYWEWDILTNELVWSDEVYRIYGMNPSLGKPTYEVVVQTLAPEYRQQFAAAIEDTVQYGKPFEGEYRIVGLDGLVRYTHTIGEVTRDSNGNPLTMFGVVQDITESKLAEKALRESEAKYRTLVSEMFVGFALNEIICDAEGNPIDYVTIEINKAFEEHMMMSRDMVIGKKVSEILPPEELKHWLGVFGPVALLGQPARYKMHSTISNRVFDGLAYCPEKGKFAITFYDITEREQAEKALRESEEKYKALVENVDVGIFQSTLDGTFLHANSAVVKMSGYDSLEDFLHRRAQNLYVNSAERNHILHELTSHGFVHNIEVLLAKKDGSQYWISMSAILLKGSADKPTTILGTVEDITARKEAEEKIKILLHEKDVLLKEVHHRIKNNMNTIDSLLMLQMYSHDDPAIKDALQDAASRVRTMMVLYEKLYRSNNFNEISIQEYIPSLLDNIKRVFPHHNFVRITTRLEDIILAPELLSTLGIILNELTTNALKYAFPGRAEGTITVTATKEADRVCLMFEDDGAGMPEEISFENSTGFGMQLIGLLINQIKGSIKVERKHGTKFIIWLPYSSL